MEVVSELNMDYFLTEPKFDGINFKLLIMVVERLNATYMIQTLDVHYKLVNLRIHFFSITSPLFFLHFLVFLFLASVPPLSLLLSFYIFLFIDS